jgi:hypothetical protein
MATASARDDDEEASVSKEVAFISGPLDTGSNTSYFRQYYISRIDVAIQRGETVIGPLPHGVDADALEYLLAYPVTPDRIYFRDPRRK